MASAALPFLMAVAFRPRSGRNTDGSVHTCSPAPEKQASRSGQNARSASSRQEGVRVLCYIIRVIVASPDGLDACANRRGYPPRKPLPAKRIPADIRSLCRAYTGEAVRSLAAIMRNGDTHPSTRAAVAILLDRGWGKAAQTHTGEDGDESG